MKTTKELLGAVNKRITEGETTITRATLRKDKYRFKTSKPHRSG